MKYIISYFFFCAIITSSIAQKVIESKSSPLPIVRTFQVEPDVKIAVTDWGGQGLPLLFIPSWHATAHVFDDFAPRFNDNYRVFILDIRGHGESSRPSNGYNIDVLTNDMLTILDSLKIDRVTLLGLSRSASLISHFAARYSNRINKLIYLSGSIDRAFARDYFSQPETRKLLSSLDPLMRSIMENCKTEQNDETPIPELADILPSNAFDAGLDTIGVIWRQNDPVPPYKQIAAPALAFWADPPPPIPKINSALAQCNQIPKDSALKELENVLLPYRVKLKHDLELFENDMIKGVSIVVPNAEYYVYVSHPELVEKEIRNFLDRKD